MKKYFVATLVAAGVLLSACGGGIGGATNTVTITASPEPLPFPTEPTVADKESMFLETMRNSGIAWLMSANSNDLLSLARQTCQILDSGYTVDQLIQEVAVMFMDRGMTNDPELYRGTGFLIGASVAAFCPQYANQFNA